MVKKTENGETFLNFIQDKEKNLVTSNRMTIYIIKLDESISEELLTSLVDYCKVFFLGLKVKIHKEEINIPEMY